MLIENMTAGEAVAPKNLTIVGALRSNGVVDEWCIFPLGNYLNDMVLLLEDKILYSQRKFSQLLILKYCRERINSLYGCLPLLLILSN